jgi:hypothetical protein
MGNIGLQKDGILNLFDIPHFGRSAKINMLHEDVVEMHAQRLLMAQQASLN